MQRTAWTTRTNWVALLKPCSFCHCETFQKVINIAHWFGVASTLATSIDRHLEEAGVAKERATCESSTKTLSHTGPALKKSPTYCTYKSFDVMLNMGRHTIKHQCQWITTYSSIGSEPFWIISACLVNVERSWDSGGLWHNSRYQNQKTFLDSSTTHYDCSMILNWNNIKPSRIQW